MSTQLIVILIMVGASVVQGIVKALREQAAKKQAEDRRLRMQHEAMQRGPSTMREPSRGDEMIQIPQGRPADPDQSESTGDPLADLLRRLPGGTPGTTVPMPAPARKPKQTELDRARAAGEKRRAAEMARAAQQARAGEQARAAQQARPQDVMRQPMATRALPQQNLPREMRPIPMPPKQGQQRGEGQQPQRGQGQRQQRPSRQERKQRVEQMVTEEMRDEQRQHEVQQRLAAVRPEAVGVSTVRGANIGGARMTARDWRRAMILREILEPPLSIREG